MELFIIVDCWPVWVVYSSTLPNLCKVSYDFYALAWINERINVAVSYVRDSFERSTPLVWFGVNSFGCHMTLTYLFSAEVTPPTEITMFRYIRSICE